jgi:hypothetical protein
MTMTLIGFAGEDEGHFRAITKLVDDTLIAQIDWLQDILESCRAWRGIRSNQRWYKYAPEDAYDLRPVTINGMTIKPQGQIAGKPLKPEASMWRKVLLLFHHAEPRPDIVVLVRDLDGYPERRDGIDQVRNDLTWSFPIVTATPNPEIEGWLVSGFVPTNEAERVQLEQVRQELSFDPTLKSHNLTSHPNTAATDAKRVLVRLCEGDRDREYACLEREKLRERGAFNGARAFLEEVEQRVLPVFTPAHLISLRR